MPNKHQANAQSNGWEFEYAAALFLFLRYSHLIKEIGVEKDEDIRILKNDGNFIVAQAKSSLEIKDIYEKPHYPEIKKSFKSLSDTGLENIDKYVLINNFRDPFGNDSYVKFKNDEEQEYKIIDFPDAVIKKLKKYCKSEKINLDFNKVFYQFVQFQGQNPAEYIKRVLTSELTKINKSAEASSDIILNKLLVFFRNNARQKDGGIDKSALLGAIYSCIVRNSLSLEDISKYSEVEVEIVDAGIMNEINRFFTDSSYTLATYSNIVGDYFDYCVNNNFLRSKPESLKSYISSIIEADVPKYFLAFFDKAEYDVLKMYKLFIAFVCLKNTLIDDVRRAFCYETN